MKQMWGIRVDPILTTHPGAFKREQQNVKKIREIKRRTPIRRKRVLKAMLLPKQIFPREYIHEKGEPHGFSSRVGVPLIYVNQSPDILRKEGEYFLHNYSRRKGVGHIIAHELGHAVADEHLLYGNMNEFMSIVSEWEYWKRNDARKFSQMLLPTFTRERDERTGKNKRVRNTPIVHPYVAQVVIRLFRHFPRAKERNTVVREIIANGLTSVSQINKLLWRKIREKMKR